MHVLVYLLHQVIKFAKFIGDVLCAVCKRGLLPRIHLHTLQVDVIAHYITALTREAPFPLSDTCNSPFFQGGRGNAAG